METVNKENLRNSIITLAQNETAFNQTCMTVSGKGSDLAKTNLRFRARRKQINQGLSIALADLAKEKGDFLKQKQNWNTYHCQNTVTTSNGRLYSNYCKNRNCEICQDIKRAEIINKYLPIIKTWTQPHLITLTVKTCTEHELKSRIIKMFEAFKRIKNKYRKRSSRGKGFEFLGIKSLECGFDLKTERYNPHFHLIVENKQIGEALIHDWLEIWTANYTDQLAQNIKYIKNTEQDQINTLKYITKPSINTQETGNKIYISALDNIFDAIKGKRIFERFGFNTKKTQVKPKNEITILKNFKEWKYISKTLDWVNIDTGEVLSEQLNLL